MMLPQEHGLPKQTLWMALAATGSAAVRTLGSCFASIPGFAHHEAGMPFSGSNNDLLLASVSILPVTQAWDQQRARCSHRGWVELFRRVWEPMLFAKWPFCPPYKNLMFMMWGSKGSGILGIPGMQPSSKWWLALQLLLPSKDLQVWKWENKTQSWWGWFCRGLHSNLSVREKKKFETHCKTKLKGHLIWPLTRCWLHELLSHPVFAVPWSSVATWLPPGTKSSLSNSKDNRWYHMQFLLCARCRNKPLKCVI